MRPPDTRPGPASQMNFIKAVQELVDAGVEFVIIGGWAAALHGSSYCTLDLDICYSPSHENLERLAAALAPFHPTSNDLPFGWNEGTLNWALSTDLGKVDLLAEVSGVGHFEDVREHSVLMPAFEREVLTLDLPALIASRRAAGRPKDLALLPELESLLEATEPE